MEGSKGGRRRSRLNKQDWQELLERFDGAAMTVEEFCVREGSEAEKYLLLAALNLVDCVAATKVTRSQANTSRSGRSATRR